MKAIQITMDPELLARLDADEEARRLGRSAVLRRALEEYLQRRRSRSISEAYHAGYGAAGGGVGEEFQGWAEEGAWPEQ